MKKKFLIFVLIIFIFLLISFCLIKSKTSTKTNTNETSRDFIIQDNTVSKINTHGENSGIYVGVTENEKDNYLFVSIKIDKTTSKENQIKSLISEIATSIGYKIDINSIEVDKDIIKIDFSDTGAPFELENSYSQTNSQKYYITSNYLVAKTIFDSINKTLKSYFGENTEIYFSVNQENINITNEILNIDINKNNPY